MIAKLRNIIARLLHVYKSISKPEILAGLILSVAIIAVTINTSSVIMKNYKLERSVQIMEQRVAVAQYELDNQRLRNDYYKTDAFLEIAARKQLSKGVAGENLIIVPRSVALANLPAGYETIVNQETESRSDQKTNLSNPEKWWQFLQGNLD